MTVLTGCMAEVGEVKINEDGSGTIKVFAGFTKEGLKSFMEMEAGLEPGETDVDITEQLKEEMADLKTFEYNGVTYYGELEEDSFSSIDELSTSGTEISGAFDSESGMQIIPVEGEYGKFRVLFSVDASVDLEDDLRSEVNSYDEDISEEEMAELLKSMVMVLKITLPTTVRQLQGPTLGVTIVDGTTIEIDLLKLSSQTDTDTVYEFTNSNTATPTDVIIKEKKQFTDVPTDAWCYDAIQYMADNGIVSGYGDGKFNPNGNITYAQFCQIVSKTCGLETGENNGYWAYNAIESCLLWNIIGTRGEINGTNYDVSMPREAAVAGIYRMMNLLYEVDATSNDDTITADDIPDYSQISDAYKDDVVAAYNIGITNGVDSNRTFSPKSILTRAQVCQLIYNLLA